MKQLLIEHGMSTSGRKKDLLRRLEGVVHANVGAIEDVQEEDVNEREQNNVHNVVNQIDEVAEPPRTNQCSANMQNVSDVPPFDVNVEREEFNRFVGERERELFERERELFERERAFWLASKSAEQRNASHGTGKRAFTIREISDSLPEFIPMDTNKGDAAKFVKRIRDLQEVYEWDQKLVLFAAQTRLRAQARIWNDNHVTVFRSFNEFADALQSVFPPSDTDTDIHIQMLDTQRMSNEGLLEYYFRMCALAQKGDISEAATILYIRRGLKDTALQNVLVCIDVTTLGALHNAIKRYCENNNQRPGPSEWRSGNQPRAEPYSKPFTNITASVTNGQNTVGRLTDLQPRNRRCYNCAELGHIATACPIPDRRDKCNVCNRSGHRAEECRSKPSDTPVLRIAEEKCEQFQLQKNVLVNGIPFNAIIDGGSTKSLIRRTSALVAGQIEPCAPFNFKGFGGSYVPSEERLISTVEVDGKTCEGSLYVVEDMHLSSNLLLGTDLLCQSGRRLVIERTSCRVEPDAEENRADRDGQVSGRAELSEDIRRTH